MPKSKRNVKKAKVGRPKTTGPGVALMVRMHKPQLRAIDNWINGSRISRAEAVRQLVNWALNQRIS